MKIERIMGRMKSIFHVSASGTKETKLNAKPGSSESAEEILAYVENAVNETGFELFEILATGNSVSYFIVKK